MPANRLCYYDPELIQASSEHVEVDVCVYGGNSGGVAAAVQAARLGKSVILLEPSDHVGGLSSSGLGYTDFGRKGAIGGLAREFYRALGAHYGVAEEWTFEPHVAEAAYTAMLAEAKVPVRFRQFLHEVEVMGGAITRILLEGGLSVQARMFIDCTYEGDLMAQAKVPYTWGREPNSQYGETINGVQVHKGHQFDFPVDPYVVPGQPASGVLPGIDPSPLAPPGSGDRRIQAYNFRMCLTKVAANRIPFPKPEGYDPQWYELHLRYVAAGWQSMFGKFDPIRGDKTDTNNHGATSTDFIGQNHAWPDAGYAARERIFQAHVAYQQGLMWFWANDPRVPETVRVRMAQWGLPKDEFTATGGWPHQLYVREARRLVGDYVQTEADCTGKRAVEDGVGLGSYNMDSHNCRRFILDGRVMNEGDVQIGVPKPYRISYRAIIPPKGTVANLFIPVCLSASHIAYGSIRMEPVFMVLAQSAATAACQAIDAKQAVHEVDYATLRARLLKDGQVLDPAG
jgi:hypothetical protein